MNSQNDRAPSFINGLPGDGPATVLAWLPGVGRIPPTVSHPLSTFQTQV